MKNARVYWIRRLGWGMGGIGLLGGIASFFISTWHLRNAPIAPNATTGEIHPFFVRGVTIYLNDFDFAFETCFFRSMVILCVLGGALLGWAERLGSSRT